jgi:signal transduction histidine kinase
MIRDLLDFTRARLGAGIPIQRIEIDFHHETQQIVEELRAAYPKRTIVFEQAGNGTGSWDPDRVAQVLTNLVANAVAYSPSDQPVLVRTEGRTEQVVLRVHNGGPPIDEAILPNLFEPLKQGDNTVGADSRSIGLGLYIVRQLVLAHGGTVEVRSTLQEGTTFVARFPRVAAPPSEEHESA